MPSDAIPDFASNPVRRIAEQAIDVWHNAELGLAQGLVRWYKETFNRQDQPTGIGRDGESLFFFGSVIPRMAKVAFVLAAAGNIIPRFL